MAIQKYRYLRRHCIMSNSVAQNENNEIMCSDNCEALIIYEKVKICIVTFLLKRQRKCKETEQDSVPNTYRRQSLLPSTSYQSNQTERSGFGYRSREVEVVRNLHLQEATLKLNWLSGNCQYTKKTSLLIINITPLKISYHNSNMSSNSTS